VASAILSDEIDLCLQPVLYRTTPRQAPTPASGRDARAFPSVSGTAPADLPA
jgi:hypothetical protein